MDLIIESVGKAPANLKDYMQTMSQLDNVPRKEKQFRNFTANSLNLRGKSGETTVTEIWKFLSNLREEQKLQNLAAQKKGKEDMKASKASNSKVPSTEEDGSDSQGENNNAPPESTSKTKEPVVTSQTQSNSKLPNDQQSKKFDKKAVVKAMKKTLKKQKEKGMALKTLQKAIQKELNADKSEKKAIKTIIKEQCKDKDKSNARFEMEGKMVRLKVD